MNNNNTLSIEELNELMNLKAGESETPSSSELEAAKINEYKDNRRNHYSQLLSVEEQLDMLFHELKTNGSITVEGEWFNSVQAVKDAHPKPI